MAYGAGMLVTDDGTTGSSSSQVRSSLRDTVTDLYSDTRLTPMLRRLIGHSRALLGAVAGSVSLVDPVNDRYDKMAEIGIPCRLGQSFPLDEGATGTAVASRMPIVIEDYSGLRRGHLPRSHPASHGTAVAAPLWWRDKVIGVNVAFAGRRRSFSTAELDSFEELTQSVAPAVMRVGRTVPSLAGMLREHGRLLAAGNGIETVVTEAGAVTPVARRVAAAAVDIVDAAHACAVRRSGSRLRVAVVHRRAELMLLVQDEAGQRPSDGDPLGLGAHTWQDLQARAGSRTGGHLAVEHIEGWGTLVRAAFPTGRTGESARPQAAPSPLTAREREVLALLAQGLPDREIAARLVISRKTVEKHVGALLRKTGTHTRTAAALHAVELGWLDRD